MNLISDEKQSRLVESMKTEARVVCIPDLNDLIDRSIDILYTVVLEDSTKSLRWCQGKVISVIDDKNNQEPSGLGSST